MSSCEIAAAVCRTVAFKNEITLLVNKLKEFKQEHAKHKVTHSGYPSASDLSPQLVGIGKKGGELVNLLKWFGYSQTTQRLSANGSPTQAEEETVAGNKTLWDEHKAVAGSPSLCDPWALGLAIRFSRQLLVFRGTRLSHPPSHSQSGSPCEREVHLGSPMLPGPQVRLPAGDHSLVVLHPFTPVPCDPSHNIILPCHSTPAPCAPSLVVLHPPLSISTPSLRSFPCHTSSPPLSMLSFHARPSCSFPCRPPTRRVSRART